MTTTPVTRPPATVRPVTGAVATRRLDRRTRVRWLYNVAALVLFAVMVFPVYWVVTTAFKPGDQIQDYTPHWFFTPTLDNFRDALTRNGSIFWQDLLNSVIIVVSVVALSAAIGFLAALAIARSKFRGKKAYIVLIIMVQMVPLTALIIPLYIVLSNYNLAQDSRIGVIITYLTFVLPFTVWTLRGFVTNVPPDLEEAAMVDGCTRFSAFMRVTLPLIAPGLVATSVFAFIQAWNEYLMGYIMLNSPQKQTLTVWLASFSTSKGTDWGGLMAGATLTAIPVVVFFLLVQRKVASGMTAGAVKG